MLNGLVGGLETVILGDAEALKRNAPGGGELSKLRSQRAGAPIFDAIVELQSGRFDEWRIVTNVPKAVDAILQGAPYLCHLRSREPETGEIHLRLAKDDEI